MAEPTSLVCGCTGKPHCARRMCATHYARWLRDTPPNERGLPPRFNRTFTDFVDKSGDCWLWTGTVKANGYGWWSEGGVHTYAHRYSWALRHGPITDGLWVLHSCDNPPCVNPDHLRLGTVRENVGDMLARRRNRNQNTGKTHCKNGHPLSGDNIRPGKGGKERLCRTCDNRKSRERQRRLRAERKANA